MQRPSYIQSQQQPSYFHGGSNRRPYLCYDKATGHAQAGFGSEVAGDHDTEAGFWKSELGRAGVHDLIHHHHRAAAVSLAGLDWRRRASKRSRHSRFLGIKRTLFPHELFIQNARAKNKESLFILKIT